MPKAFFYKAIEGNCKAALIKLSDRLHNSATLYTFTFERMRKYILETDEFLIPMASYCKNYYPEYTNAFTILKSNIHSLNNSMRIMMEKFDKENATTSVEIANGVNGSNK